MTTKQPKILFFVTEDWFVCSHWLPLIAGATSMGLAVVVVTRTDKHAEYIRQLGVRVIPFEISRRGSNIFRELGTVLKLFTIYRNEKPDIVHHVAMKPMLYGSLVARLSRVPHRINWVAGMGWLFVSKQRRAKIIQVIVRKLLGMLLRGTTVIVENQDDQKIISDLGVSSRDIHLVRGAGVDTSRYLPSPEPLGDKLVVLPARMLWDKGVGEFVDAARQLKARGVPAKYVLVGAPDTENPASVSEFQLKEWQMDGVIEWWGRCEDMPSVYAQCHIVCLPSYREGLPKSLLEAASCALPIVTTNVPGCREVVQDGDNGYLVEPRNSLALADALAKLLSDPELRKQMGYRGRERVIDEFSQEIIVAKVLELYRETLL